MMRIDSQSIEDHIPSYLTKSQKEGLVKWLKEFPRRIDYYFEGYRDELLQGDGWTGLDVMQFESGDKKTVSGIVLSNSCDIDPENDRVHSPRLVFAPLIPLSRYERLLGNEKIGQAAIDAKLSAIRSQSVTSVFYLPKGEDLAEDHIALLDNIHTVPLSYFSQKSDRKKLFTLGMAGFYLFVFKLSVHFCRLHEEVQRS